jgi:hypothetical protein
LHVCERHRLKTARSDKGRRKLNAGLQSMSGVFRRRETWKKREDKRGGNDWEHISDIRKGGKPNDPTNRNWIIVGTNVCSDGACSWHKYFSGMKTITVLTCQAPIKILAAAICRN